MKIMITYINVLFLIMLASSNFSCEKESEKYSEDFFFGTWNQKVENPNNFPFYYAQGFEFKKDGTASPRYDMNKTNSFITNYEHVGTWSYNTDSQELTFTEEDSNFPSSYSTEFLSDDEIKLINPITKEVYLFQRE